MRYAILSDIHANLDALEAVLEAVDGQSIDRVICLGDVVGYGPQPGECVARLQDIGSTIIAGNHDFAVAGRIDISNFNVLAREATLWTREKLDTCALNFLGGLPLVIELDGFTVVHGTLHAPELFDYVQTSYDAHLAMRAMTQPICFIGHSHVPITFVESGAISYRLDGQADVREGTKTIMNVGSVGQPRDFDPRSCYAIYDTEQARAELHRVEYDVDSVVRKIVEAGLPRPLGERLRTGR